jgi:hypothetical protein
MPKLSEAYNFFKKDEEWTEFDCGYCDRRVSAGVLIGAIPRFDGNLSTGRGQAVVICSVCHGLSVQAEHEVYPAPRVGDSVAGLGELVSAAWEEARNALAARAPTAAELMCRKLLMHVAVEHGADEGEGFEFYVDFLVEEGVITRRMKPWVDRIRKHANRATHDIVPVEFDRARDTLEFTEQLLRIVYEMPHRMKERAPEQT